MRYTDDQMELVFKLWEWSMVHECHMHSFISEMVNRIRDGNVLYSQHERIQLNDARKIYIDKTNDKEINEI